MPAQARSCENDQNDRVQFSITGADGREKTWSLSGVDRASKALNRSILSCGVVIALSVAAPAAIIYMMAQHSTQEKVVYSLGSVVATGAVWIGSRAARWLKEQVKRRWRGRRGKTPDSDAGHG